MVTTTGSTKRSVVTAFYRFAWSIKDRCFVKLRLTVEEGSPFRLFIVENVVNLTGPNLCQFELPNNTGPAVVLRKIKYSISERFALYSSSDLVPSKNPVMAKDLEAARSALRITVRDMSTWVEPVTDASVSIYLGDDSRSKARPKKASASEPVKDAEPVQAPPLPSKRYDPLAIEKSKAPSKHEKGPDVVALLKKDMTDAWIARFTAQITSVIKMLRDVDIKELSLADRSVRESTVMRTFECVSWFTMLLEACGDETEWHTLLDSDSLGGLIDVWAQRHSKLAPLQHHRLVTVINMFRRARGD